MVTLFKNGKIRTIDAKAPAAKAFVVEDGVYKEVSNNEDIDEIRSKYHIDEEIDFKGKDVLPAFNDSHMHFIDMARSMTTVDLTETQSVEDIVATLSRNISMKNQGGWIEAIGWNQDFFTKGEKRFPDKNDLDKVSAEVPIIAVRNCAHIATLNSKGLATLGLTAGSVHEYSDLAEYQSDGELNGVVKEKLLDRVRSSISVLDEDIIEKLTLAAQKKLFSLGLTSVQSDDIGFMPNGDYDLWFNTLNDLENASKLRMRLSEQCMLKSPDVICNFANNGNGYGGNHRLRRTCIKLYNDGSLGARTAGLSVPYNDDRSTCGLTYYEPEELYALIKSAHDNGFPVGVHAIGDKAIKMTLDAIERDQLTNNRKFRDGIIHVQITDNEVLERFHRLDVMALVQPVFINGDMHIVRDRVGELADTSYAWKTLIDEGVHVSFGTDCPVESCDPIPNIFSAVTRRSVNKANSEYYRKDQCISMEQAIYAYTMESAYCSGEESAKGSITKGKIADFIVLNRDIFDDEDEDSILETKVMQTYVDGQLVFERGKSND